MTLIEALEKLTLITKNGLDTVIQIQDSANESITIDEQHVKYTFSESLS